MTFLRLIQRNHWTDLRLLAVSLLLCGCTKDPLPPYGEVAILLSTDMSVPDAFDTLVLERNQGERWVFTAGTPSPMNGGPCDDLTNAYENALKLPSSLVLRSNREEPVTLDFTLKACKGSSLVFTRSFPVEMPKPGEQRMVRAPIRWLCTNWEKRCFGCNEAAGSLEQHCFHKHITPQQSSQACETSACTDDSKVFFTALEVRPSELELYEEASAQRPNCFDARQTFAASNDAVTSVPVNWQIHPEDSSRRFCQATVDETWISEPTLNLALVLPPGDLGTCDASRCLIALEASTPTGWARESPGSDALVLPDAVCHLLDSGQVLEVLASLGAQQKGFTTPWCSIENDPDLPKYVLPAEGKRYTFDDPRLWSTEDKSPPKLQTDVGSLADVFSEIAVSGTGAGRFTNQQFARAEARLIVSPEFTLAAWVSLTALDPDTDVGATNPMPIISDVDSSCMTGARLQLRSNADRSKILLELGIPTGTVADSANVCQLRWSCTSFADKSFIGGFFTPWNPGIWRHVAVVQTGTTPSDKSLTLYLDGTVAEQLGTCTEASTIEPHDNGNFYVGSSRAELDAVGSHPILIDELAIYPYAFDVIELQRLYLASATVPGPSGLRWGVWGGQGSHAAIKPGSPLAVSVTDLDNASAGTYANLSAPLDLKNADGKPRVRDLSDFDEAVIVADVPPQKPFQFSLLSDHGTRQCTWHLIGKTSPENLQYSDTYVIDLRRPSWCIDPACTFDLSRVEQASLGSDWKNGERSNEPLTYSVRALAFRKRALAEPSLGRSKAIGGIWGPDGLCWRSISYTPRWDVAPLNAREGFVDFPAPTDTPSWSTDNQLPEIAIELTGDRGFGTRSLMPCVTMQLDVDWDLASTGTSEPEFALKDDRNRTATFKLPKQTPGMVNVNLESRPSFIWPVPQPRGTETMEAAENAAYREIRSSVTRISIRSTQATTVKGIRCCDGVGICQDLR